MSPIVWWDTSGFDTKEGQSKLNVEEATRVSGVVRCLLDNDVPAGRIGVIAFYAAQASCVSNKLAHAPHGVVREMTDDNDDDDCESFLPSDVQVSTVDAFQGQEKDVIIITLCGAPLSTFTNAERPERCADARKATSHRRRSRRGGAKVQSFGVGGNFEMCEIHTKWIHSLDV